MYMGHSESQTGTHTGALCASIGLWSPRYQKRSPDSHIISSPWQELGFKATGESFLGRLSGMHPVHYHVASYTFTLRGHTSFLAVLAHITPPLRRVLSLPWPLKYGEHSGSVLESHELYGTSYR